MQPAHWVIHIAAADGVALASAFSTRMAYEQRKRLIGIAKQAPFQPLADTPAAHSNRPVCA